MGFFHARKPSETSVAIENYNLKLSWFLASTNCFFIRPCPKLYDTDILIMNLNFENIEQCTQPPDVRHFQHIYTNNAHIFSAFFVIYIILIVQMTIFAKYFSYAKIFYNWIRISYWCCRVFSHVLHLAGALMEHFLEGIANLFFWVEFPEPWQSTSLKEIFH